MTTMLAIGFALVPVLGLIALLKMADRIERKSQERYERQILLTDAIHRELGAVVAPMVSRRRAGGWLVGIAVPFDRPDAVTTIVRITDHVFASLGEVYELMLSRQTVVRRPELSYRRGLAGERPTRRAA